MVNKMNPCGFDVGDGNGGDADIQERNELVLQCVQCDNTDCIVKKHLIGNKESIENFILYYTSDTAEREQMKQTLEDYINEEAKQ